MQQTSAEFDALWLGVPPPEEEEETKAKAASAEETPPRARNPPPPLSPKSVAHILSDFESALDNDNNDDEVLGALRALRNALTDAGVRDAVPLERVFPFLDARDEPRVLLTALQVCCNSIAEGHAANKARVWAALSPARVDGILAASRAARNALAYLVLHCGHAADDLGLLERLYGADGADPTEMGVVLAGSLLSTAPPAVAVRPALYAALAVASEDHASVTRENALAVLARVDDSDMPLQALANLTLSAAFAPDAHGEALLRRATDQLRRREDVIPCLRVIANVGGRSRRLQDLAGELGAVELLMGECGIDEDNPFTREWAVVGLRCLTEGHDANQERIASLEAQRVEPNAALRSMGVTAQLDPETGKVRLKPVE